MFWRPRLAAPAIRLISAVVAAFELQAVRHLRTIGITLGLLILGGSAGSILDMHRTMIAVASEEVSDLATVFSEQASRYIQIIDGRLLDVQRRVRDMAVETPDGLRLAFGTSESRAFMATLVRNLPAGHGMAVFDAGGGLLNRGDDGPSFNIADRAYFSWLRDHAGGQLAVGEPAISQATGAPCFFIVRRLSGAEGGFLGAVVASVDTAYLRDLYQSVGRGRHVSVTLLRPDGMLLARYSADAPTAKMIPQGSPWFGLAAAGGGTYRAASDFSSRRAIISVHPLRDYPFVLNVAAGEDDVLALWRREAIYKAGAATVMAGGILVLFLGVARRLRATEAHNARLSDSASALRASEARLDWAQEVAGIGSWEVDIVTGIGIWSRNLFRIGGLDSRFVPAEATLARMCHPDDAGARAAWYADLTEGRERGPIDIRIFRPDGEMRIMHTEGRSIVDADGAIRRLAGTTRDVTELRLLERQLAQAQKMEAIGNLTGGMAHDFNNVLGIIIGNLDLLQPLIEHELEASELCAEALDGAIRCADLIQRLLAFARRQPLYPQLTDVNALVGDIVRLLGRTLGEGIALTVKQDAALWPVMVDPVQLQAALVNLATNARDAMQDGGQLHIDTRNIVVTSSSDTRHSDIDPGAYAVVTVRDSGTGIPPEIVGRIFEPFFSTKGPDKGTGLGLSMVFGFVKQSGGHLSVLSEPGAGTSFRLYLPRTDDVVAPSSCVSSMGNVPEGSESILVVEDNVATRRAAVRQLGVLGYRVKEANDVGAALAILSRGERVNLILTDLVLPGPRDGLDLVLEAMRRWPELKVLLMSGYPGLRDTDQRLAGCRLTLIDKPFFLDELAVAVRQALSIDTPASATASLTLGEP